MSVSGLTDKWTLLSEQQVKELEEEISEATGNFIRMYGHSRDYPVLRDISIIVQINKSIPQVYATFVEYQPHHLQKIIGQVDQENIPEGIVDLSDYLNQATLDTGIRKSFMEDE